MPSGRRRLAAKLPITLATPLTGDATSGASAKAGYPSCSPPPSCRAPPWSRFCSPPPSCLSGSFCPVGSVLHEDPEPDQIAASLGSIFSEGALIVLCWGL